MFIGTRPEPQVPTRSSPRPGDASLTSAPNREMSEKLPGGSHFAARCPLGLPLLQEGPHVAWPNLCRRFELTSLRDDDVTIRVQHREIRYAPIESNTELFCKIVVVLAFVADIDMQDHIVLIH